MDSGEHQRQEAVDGAARDGAERGRPRKLGGDYLGVDVNIAAGVANAAKGDQVLVSHIALGRIDVEGLGVGRRKRLRAEGAPRELHVVPISRA